MANKNNYYKMFNEMVDYSVDMAIGLQDVFKNYNTQQVSDAKNKLHDIEHAADAKKHDLLKKLSSEFMTPIEREDILQLAQEIDDVIDNIEDVLLRAYMFNITAIRVEAIEFTDTIVKCVNALKKSMVEFENFRKSTTIKENIIEVNRLEEVGDSIYHRAMRRLYTETNDSISVMVWTFMFDQLEKCCDCCEHVTDIIEGVIMKNS
jgi:predicted phosphate transport protein (TIGR00153 family)